MFYTLFKTHIKKFMMGPIFFFITLKIEIFSIGIPAQTDIYNKPRRANCCHLRDVKGGLKDG